MLFVFIFFFFLSSFKHYVVGKDSSYEQLSQQHHHQLQDAQQQRYYQQSSLASAMTMSTPASMASSVSTLPTLDAGSIIFDTEDGTSLTAGHSPKK